MGTQQRTGNEVTVMAMVQARFCSHFLFSRSLMLVPHPLPILGTSQLEHHIIPEQFDALNHNLYFLKVFRVFIICLTKNTC